MPAFLELHSTCHPHPAGGQPTADPTLVGGDAGDFKSPVVQLAALRDVARICIVDTLADVELLKLNP